MRKNSRILLALFLALFSSACISTADPVERALKRSNAVISDGIEAGVDTAESGESLELQARYNPCRCPAPDFEIYAWGSWTRVVVDGETAVIEALYQEADTIADRPGIGYLRLVGHFDGESAHEETGVEYSTFDVRDFRAVSP